MQYLDRRVWQSAFSAIRMMSVVAVFLLLSRASIGQERQEEVDDCPDLDTCMERLFDVAEPSDSPYLTVSVKEWTVARRLSQFGDEAVERLVPLLAQTDVDVAQVAAAALRGVDHIDARFLPDITAALDSGMNFGWLPPALGSIHTDEAARQAVQRYLEAGDAGGNQISVAVERSGARALPFILKAAQCEDGCTAHRHYLLGYILGEMDAQTRAKAARGLLASLSGASTVDARAGMVCMIQFLDTPGMVVENQLLQLKKDDPSLQVCVDKALIGIGSASAGEIFATWLKEYPDILLLRDLAELGVNGRAAGPVVVSLLGSEDWEVRIGAARTLGYLQYSPAVSKLVALLHNDADVVMNLIASESLVRIGGREATAALQNASRNHWHPRVRQSAALILDRDEMNSQLAIAKGGHFPAAFFDFEHFSTESCESIALAMIEESRDTKLYTRYASDQLESLAYTSEIVGISASDEAQQRTADPDGIIEIRADNVKEIREEIRQVPQKALKVRGGWLIGSNRGEWGGELVFIDSSGSSHNILKENIEDIYQLGDRLIAITGLAHLSSNRGAIHELSRDSDGRWRSVLWRTLPGAPNSSWFVDTGEILINTYGGGSILLGKDGAMRMAACSE